MEKHGTPKLIKKKKEKKTICMLIKKAIMEG